MAKIRNNLDFEESLSEDWSKDLDVVEMPLGKSPMLWLTVAISILGILTVGRLFYLGVLQHGIYSARADANLDIVKRISAPRGLILDRYGKVIADNRAVWSALLDVRQYIKNKTLDAPTMDAVQNVLGLSPDDVLASIENSAGLNDFTSPVVLSSDLTQDQILKLKSLGLDTIIIENGYLRSYPVGPEFSSVLGYTSLASPADLKANPALNGEDFVGKAGLEAYYDSALRGIPGEIVDYRNARGDILGEVQKSDPVQPQPLRTSIDSEFQKYFYNRLSQGLSSLGKTTGVGIAMNPQTGEVLSLISLPSYDPNIFTKASESAARKDIVTSGLKPLFNRAISGSYSPGSTIKPLVGIAALTESVISPGRTIFSPGYLDIPNPYNPGKTTRYLDWRYQGDVDMSSAIAQSSDVYFYEVGGGWGDIKGLGITRLIDWWKKFGLGEKSGIDLPGEVKGFLPNPAWKESVSKTSWLLGDTFNVSIGQGDLELTPVQLLSYISSVANGGTLYRPHLKVEDSKITADLTSYAAAIQEVQKGMKEAVTSKLGTAYTLSDLPFTIGAKTGSAQIQNNTKENAFFVGYAPFDHPQIAILILVEHAKEGSLNAVPIAKDVLRWYYENRIR
jgi:penicillin-binding protein 2